MTENTVTLFPDASGSEDLRKAMEESGVNVDMAVFDPQQRTPYVQSRSVTVRGETNIRRFFVARKRSKR